MGRKRKPLPLLSSIKIESVAAEGKSISRIKLNPDDESAIVVFIPYGAPGDIADVQIDKKKHSFAEGHIVRLVEPSAARIEPKCAHFGVCGGCKWQHLPYEEQLKWKQKQVEDVLKRIAKVEMPPVAPILGSSQIWNYRNKMEYTFSNKKWRTWEEIKRGGEFSDSSNALGFHIPGAFDKVLHINQCHLQSELGDRIRNFLFELAEKKHLSFYDIKNNEGLLRTLMIRISSTGDIMVCVVFGENNTTQINEVMEELKVNFPEITSLLYVVNLKLNDSISDQEICVYSGSDSIIEEMEGLKFNVNAKSFYQTNSKQAYELYKVVRKLAGLENPADAASADKPLVYDLYTGTGTIANFVAKNASKVIGIEYVEAAIEDAKKNSEINGIDNTLFYAGDMKDVLTSEFIERHGHPDIMIIDPPRAGMHEDVVNVILNARSEVIVYVSCNPATQARDLALLDKKYKVTEIQPVDMFPHTHHVENVVRLKLR
ncbi:MAG: 23S rRNA (uracil(1939)-C(5))-methyltransferase RlmD [Bacteroides sp.]|nr:23S rRNA (uracil(1939)-C(5))-methyltransferase RlmD [Bacteroides sp.]